MRVKCVTDHGSKWHPSAEVVFLGLMISVIVRRIVTLNPAGTSCLQPIVAVMYATAIYYCYYHSTPAMQSTRYLQWTRTPCTLHFVHCALYVEPLTVLPSRTASGSIPSGRVDSPTRGLNRFEPTWTRCANFISSTSTMVNVHTTIHDSFSEE